MEVPQNGWFIWENTMKTSVTTIHPWIIDTEELTIQMAIDIQMLLYYGKLTDTGVDLPKFRS